MKRHLSTSPRDRPDFLIIGAMKSGTTSLYSDLCKYNQILMPTNKEPWVLTEHRGVEYHRSRYRRLFSGAAEINICGEATTGYAFAPTFPGVPKQAYALCGTALKIIYILRRPVDRTISHLRHDVATGRIPESSIEKALREDSRYIDVSDYPMQLSLWLEFFSREQVLVLGFDDFVNNRAAVGKKVANFLGVESENDNIKQQSYDILNRSIDPKRTPLAMSAIIRSNFYREVLHPVVPTKVREIAKSVLLKKAKNKKFKCLSQESEYWLSQRLAGVEAETERLVGHDVFI